MSVFGERWRKLPQIFCLFLACTGLAARPLERWIEWDELSATINNQRVSLVLPDGTRLRGIVRGLQGEDLILDVRRSSNLHLHPKGRTGISRVQVSVIDLSLRVQPGDKRGSTIGLTLGAVVVSPAVVVLGEANHEGLGMVVLIAGAAVGLYIGHHYFDRDQIDVSHLRIHVVQQQTQVP